MFSLQLKRIKAPVPVEHSTRVYANTIYINIYIKTPTPDVPTDFLSQTTTLMKRKYFGVVKVFKVFKVLV